MQGYTETKQSIQIHGNGCLLIILLLIGIAIGIGIGWLIFVK